MAFCFQSIRSGSSGNCLAFWTDKTRIFVDCGLRSQKLCREVMALHTGCPSKLDAVVVSHAHSDHVNYSALRVLEKESIPIWVHKDSASQVLHKHFLGRPFKSLNIKHYDGRSFSTGDLEIDAVEVAHHPEYPTFGFEIHSHCGGRPYKAVVVTDFMEWKKVLKHLLNADFIYVEANHDPGLLRLYPNPNSYYHMMNERTGELLCEVVKQSRSAPKAVMLGHLSAERNNPPLALKAVRTAFEAHGLPLDFDLLVAPRDKASDIVEIAS